MKKDAVMQGTMAISYEERDVSAKVVLKFSQGDFCICLLVPPAGYVKRIFRDPTT